MDINSLGEQLLSTDDIPLYSNRDWTTKDKALKPSGNKKRQIYNRGEASNYILQNIHLRQRRDHSRFSLKNIDSISKFHIIFFILSDIRFLFSIYSNDILGKIYKLVHELRNEIQNENIHPNEIGDETYQTLKKVVDIIKPKHSSKELEKITERWPSDKHKKERAVDFLDRVWGDAIRKGIISRPQLRYIDNKLYTTLTTFFSRGAKTNNEIITNWWTPTTPYTPSSVNEDFLDLYEIEKPEDAFHVTKNKKVQKYLYDLALRRKL